MERKKRRKRKKRKTFTKYYKYNQQDIYCIRRIGLLQALHTEIANEVFGDFTFNVIGDWTINTEGITLFIDPKNGNQAEITGTSKLPLYKRVRIHIRLLKLLRSGCSILKAVRICLSTLMTQ